MHSYNFNQLFRTGKTYKWHPFSYSLEPKMFPFMLISNTGDLTKEINVS